MQTINLTSRSRWRSVRLAAVLLPLLAGGPATAQEGGKRIALVIGNDQYTERPLQNAVNDARLVDTALQAAGFKTILKLNAKKVDMEEGLAELSQSLGPEDTALLFYAGHGVQIQSENYLLPVDFAVGSSIYQSKSRSLPFKTISDFLQQPHKRTIIILDACRSNPLTQAQSLQNGLANPPDLSGDSLVFLSTKANAVALDNPSGKNSFFSEALADVMAQPGLPIADLISRVTLRVSEETGGQQRPMQFGSMTGRFYFHPPANLSTENDPALAEKWLSDARLREQQQEWQSAIDLVNQVLRKKPGGALEELAKSKLVYLTARKEAQARFDAGDYAGAAGFYTQAHKLDLFATDAVFQGVICHLLNDHVDQAVVLLREIRVRSTTASIQKADAMLTELAAISPEAKKELQAGPPPPPPINEIFSGVTFGIPDFEAGRRFQLSNTVELSRWVKQLSAAAAATTSSSVQPASQSANPSNELATLSPEAAGLLHVELVSVSGSRDLRMRKSTELKVNSSGVNRPNTVPVRVATDPPGANLTVEGDAEQRCASPCVLMLTTERHGVKAELEGYRSEVKAITPNQSGDTLNMVLQQEIGMITVDGATAATAVVVDGRVYSRQIPASINVPAGRYEARTVQGGQILKRKEVEIKPLSPVTLKVEE